MKIAIDVSQIIYSTGVATYTKNLVKELLNIDKKNRYLLFGGALRGRNKLESFFSGCRGSFQKSILPLSPKLAHVFWNNLHIIPLETVLGKFDVFHSSDWTQPKSRAFKITTVHDLAPIKYPELTPKKIVTVHKKRLEWVKKEVDRIIVPSLSTKKDLIELGFCEDKMRVIYEAYRIEQGEKLDPNKVLLKYGIRGDFLLSVGIGPRKNTPRLVSVFKKIKSKKEMQLVLVGYPDRNYTNTEGVIVISGIAENELNVLYSKALALIYPSLYEGFGLPILQAFHNRCPVVTSNVSSMPEVAGDAALLVDPRSEDSIAEGIINALKNPETLIKKGLIRKKEFSWEKAAKKTLAVYNEANCI